MRAAPSDGRFMKARSLAVRCISQYETSTQDSTRILSCRLMCSVPLQSSIWHFLFRKSFCLTRSPPIDSNQPADDEFVDLQDPKTFTRTPVVCSSRTPTPSAVYTGSVLFSLSCTESSMLLSLTLSRTRTLCLNGRFIHS